MALLLLGVAAALASATLYAVGVTLQALEARQEPPAEALHLSLLRHLVRRPRWLAGTACVVAGWTMQALALLLAPLTVVQPALAASVVVLLLIGVRFFDEPFGRREVGAALAMATGLGLLAAVAPRQDPTHANAAVLAVGLSVLAVLALAPYVLRPTSRRAAMLVVASAGLAYAFAGFSTKFMADAFIDSAWPMLGFWFALTLAAAGLGLLSEMTALQTRSAVAVFPAVLVVQIVVAVLLAPVLANEAWNSSPPMLAFLALSLAVLTLGTSTLCGARAVSAVVAKRTPTGGA